MRVSDNRRLYKKLARFPRDEAASRYFAAAAFGIHSAALSILSIHRAAEREYRRLGSVTGAKFMPPLIYGDTHVSLAAVITL